MNGTSQLPRLKAAMAVSLPCRWGIEAGKPVTFPRTQSRDTPFPSPGRAVTADRD